MFKINRLNSNYKFGLFSVYIQHKNLLPELIKCKNDVIDNYAIEWLWAYFQRRRYTDRNYSTLSLNQKRTLFFLKGVENKYYLRIVKHLNLPVEPTVVENTLTDHRCLEEQIDNVFAKGSLTNAKYKAVVDEINDLKKLDPDLAETLSKDLVDGLHDVKE